MGQLSQLISFDPKLKQKSDEQLSRVEGCVIVLFEIYHKDLTLRATPLGAILEFNAPKRRISVQFDSDNSILKKGRLAGKSVKVPTLRRP